MKKSVICLVLISMLLISPLILAEEQSQTYSGLDRFVDNAKLFFSGGENKVALALEIREKEVNSALVNIENDDTNSANKNLENALEKLLIVQKKVSPESADEVNENVNNVVDKIEEKNLTESLNRYVLEEEKTQLVAKLVVEMNGTEGQTLSREIVQSENENRKTVKIMIQNENGEIQEIEGEEGLRNDTAVWEIVGGINEVNNNIEEWNVEHTYAEGTNSNGETKWIIEGDEENIKTSGGENDVEEENEKDPSKYDASKEEPVDKGGDTTKNEVVEGDGGEGDYAEGTTAEGENTIYEGTGGEGSSVDE